MQSLTTDKTVTSNISVLYEHDISYYFSKVGRPQFTQNQWKSCQIRDPFQELCKYLFLIQEIFSFGWKTTS